MYGQLGSSAAAAVPYTFPAAGMSDSSGVSAGGFHTCSFRTHGTTSPDEMFCWGLNSNRQLGDGTNMNQLFPKIVIIPDSRIKSITNGSDHTCMLSKTGHVWCWGSNDSWQAGGDTLTLMQNIKQVETIGSSVTAISAGDFHTCVLTVLGEVKCWGHNQHGQLGDGTTTGRYTAKPVLGLGSNVIAISSGRESTCALLSSLDPHANRVFCWGDNSSGQIGDGTTVDRLVPTPVAGSNIDDAIVISAGGFHACAMKTDMRVACWGENTSGQIGDNTVVNKTTPTIASGFPPPPDPE